MKYVFKLYVQEDSCEPRLINEFNVPEPSDYVLELFEKWSMDELKLQDNEKMLICTPADDDFYCRYTVQDGRYLSFTEIERIS